MGTLINMCLQGTALVFLVALIRLVFKDRIAPKAYLIMWYVVLARLLVPFDLPLPKNVPQTVDLPVSVNPAPLHVEVFDLSMHFEVTGTGGGLLTDGASTAATVALAVWIVGVAVTALVFIGSALRFSHRLGPLTACKNLRANNPNTPQGTWRRIRVFESEAVHTPLVWCRPLPIIVLPTGLATALTPEALGLVLDHEHAHIRHLDPLVKALFASVCCLYWFNPAVWLAFSLVNRDMELACDAAAVQMCDRATRLDYAETLVNIARTQEHRDRSWAAPSLGTPALRERVAILVSEKTPLRRTACCAFTSLVAALCLVGFAPSISASPVVVCGGYAIELPSYWEGRVDVASDGTTCIFYPAGQPDYYLAVLTTDDLESQGIQNTLGFSRISVLDNLDSGHIELWGVNYAGLSWEDVWSQAPIVNPPWPGRETEQDIVDLSTGGRYTAEELWAMEFYPQGCLDFYLDELAATLRPLA